MKHILFILLFISSFTLVALSQNEMPCMLFPSNNIWNTPIDKLPVDKNSDLYIQTIGPAISLHPDFGSGLWNNAPIGIPYTIVDGNQKKVFVQFEYADESDKGPYPIPDNPPIEGGEDSNGDRHILIVDKDNCILYELYSAYKNPDGSWRAGSGAIFDLNSNSLRPDSWTSADAAGLPILPGLVRYDEVAAGEINHMIRFTVPKTQRKYIWPARHYASSITDEKYPPMGQVFRLKNSVNISTFSKEAQVILTALKKYGMILADNGSAWFISGVPDERWNNDAINELKQIKGSDFEAVDISSLMVNANSGEAKSNTSVNNDNNNLFICDVFTNIDGSYLQIQTNSDYYVNIEIIDIFGNMLQSIYDYKLQNGLNKIFLDTRPYSSGIYFIKIQTKNNYQLLKFSLFK